MVANALSLDLLGVEMETVVLLRDVMHIQHDALPENGASDAGSVPLVFNKFFVINSDG
ncbi:hypothetical protein SK128_022069, partial [Halocaridina rubra]